MLRHMPIGTTATTNDLKTWKKCLAIVGDATDSSQLNPGQVWKRKGSRDLIAIQRKVGNSFAFKNQYGDTKTLPATSLHRLLKTKGYELKEKLDMKDLYSLFGPFLKRYPGGHLIWKALRTAFNAR